MLNKILDNRFFVLYLIPFFLGSLSVFSFSPFNFTLINFLILPLLFLLLTYVNKRTKSFYRKKPYLINFFLIGYFFGIGFFLFSNFWISYSLTFDENFKFLIPFSIIGIPCFLGLFFGISTLIIGPFLRKDIFSIFLFILSLSLVDFLRGKILTGFPWNLWSYSWAWFTEFLQILNYVGLYAFNMIVITIFCLPSIFFLRKIKLNILIFSFYVLFFLTSYIFGSFIINQNNIYKNSIADKEKINVKVISPNIKLKYDLSEKDISKLIDILIRYSEPDPNKETIFIWPEGVFSGYYFYELSQFKNKFKKNFSPNHKILFGVNTLDKNQKNFYNSLIIVDHNFEEIYSYNKKKLVPFGEFLPFEKSLNNFGLKKITEGYGSFSKGGQEKIYVQNELKILPLICYEIIFPELVQKRSDEINLIVNISEDAWFKKSIGTYQHFTKAIFRSIESNSFLVRSANQGISAIIDNKGNQIKKLEINEKGNIEMMVPIINNKQKNKNDLIFYILLFTYIIILSLRKI